MFSFAQYVFGYGKTETSSCPSGLATTSTTPPPNELAAGTSSPVLAASKAANTESVHSIASLENDWIFIDAPDNAAGDASKKKSSSLKAGHKLKTSTTDPLGDSRLSLDNIFGEHPCLSVFDNLFTYRPPTTDVPNANLEVSSIKKGGKQTKETASMVKIAAKLKKAGSNKKKNSANAGGQQQLTPQIFSTFSLKASVASKEEALSNSKKQQQHQQKAVTKKVADRSNKVAMQRNGPIIRAKKMFTHLNGIYNNRNAC